MAKSRLTNKYNPESKSNDATQEIPPEVKRGCSVVGCPLPGTLNPSTRCEESTLFLCTYHDLFSDSDVKHVVINVINHYERLFEIQQAAMQIEPFEFDSIQKNPEKWNLGENIKPKAEENCSQWVSRIKHSVRTAMKSKCLEATTAHRASRKFSSSRTGALSAAVKALTDGSLMR